MKTVQIPGVSFPVPKICLGTAFFGSVTESETAFSIMDAYMEQGGNFFNTAHEYGRGKSEACLGSWIRSRKNRDQIILTTKGGQDTAKRDGGFCDMRHDALLQDVDESLTRLGTDHVDFYLLHIDDETVTVAEVLETLEELVKAGKTRHYGCSNWSVERQREARTYAKAHGMQGFVIDEIEFTMAGNFLPGANWCQWLTDDFVAMHEEDRVCVAGYSPLASGTLSKIVRDGDYRNCRGDCFRFMTPYTFEVAKRLKNLSEETGWTATQLQLAWLLNPPYKFPSFLLPGASKISQLEEILSAQEITLTPDMVEYLHPPYQDFPHDKQLVENFKAMLRTKHENN